jgi:hypothetical protein
VPFRGGAIGLNATEGVPYSGQFQDTLIMLYLMEEEALRHQTADNLIA